MIFLISISSLRSRVRNLGLANATIHDGLEDQPAVLRVRRREVEALLTHRRERLQALLLIYLGEAGDDLLTRDVVENFLRRFEASGDEAERHHDPRVPPHRKIVPSAITARQVFVPRESVTAERMPFRVNDSACAGDSGHA
ncbi:MAG: hypothetical protein AB7T06_00565 [Kofleriaceae bacterium]